MDFAAPSLSEASAVSVMYCEQMIQSGCEVGVGCLTDHNVGVCTLLLEEVGAVVVALYRSHVGELVFDELALFFGSDERRVCVLGMLVVKSKQGVATNVARGSCTKTRC